MAFKVGRCLLRQRLHDINMTQQELANRLSMPRAQVNDYVMKRQTMSLQTAKSVAQVLGCHIDDLYEWVEVKPSERKRSRRKE